MTDPSLREALIRLGPDKPVGAELEILHGLLAAEERRARRLVCGTIAVWGLWTTMTITLVAVSFFTSVKAPELPAGAAPPPVPAVAGPQMLVSGIGAFLLMLLGSLCLPAVVMLPWWLIFLGRRSARMVQVRSSLASIESQLSLLTQTTKPPPADLPG